MASARCSASGGADRQTMNRRSAMKLLALAGLGAFAPKSATAAAIRCGCGGNDYAITPERARWQKPVLGWRVVDTLPYMSIEALANVTAWALAQWAAATGLQFVHGGDDIHIHTVDYLPHGMAANAGYPPPKGEQWAGGVYLSRNMWLTMDDNEHVGDGLRCDLRYLMLHELGHVMGLGHSRTEGSVMVATFEYPALRKLGADDIAGAKDLYADLHPKTYTGFLAGVWK